MYILFNISVIPPVFIMPAQPGVEKGKSITLSCRGAVGQPDLIYSWTKDNRAIDLRLTKYTSLNGNLQISPVSEDDEGSYRCKAKRRQHYSLSKPENLSVWCKFILLCVIRKRVSVLGSHGRV